MTKRTRKLALSRETLHQLDAASLRRVAAGTDGQGSGTVAAERSRYPACPIERTRICPLG